MIRSPIIIMSLQLHKTQWQKVHILGKFETKRLEKVIYDLL